MSLHRGHPQHVQELLRTEGLEVVAAELQHGERRRVLSFSSLPRRVKEAIVRITGEGSYGILRTESGVHVGVGTACNLARSARSRDGEPGTDPHVHDDGGGSS